MSGAPELPDCNELNRRVDELKQAGPEEPTYYELVGRIYELEMALEAAEEFDREGYACVMELQEELVRRSELVDEWMNRYLAAEEELMKLRDDPSAPCPI